MNIFYNLCFVIICFVFQYTLGQETSECSIKNNNNCDLFYLHNELVDIKDNLHGITTSGDFRQLFDLKTQLEQLLVAITVNISQLLELSNKIDLLLQSSTVVIDTRTVPAPVRPDTGNGSCYAVNTNKCLKFMRFNYHWLRALLECQDSGGRLAEIHSDEEYWFLARFVQRDNPNVRYWLGARNDVSGTWRWHESGEDIVYRWGRPNSAGTGCLTYDDGYFGQYSCTDSRPFICEYNIA